MGIPLDDELLEIVTLKCSFEYMKERESKFNDHFVSLSFPLFLYKEITFNSFSSLVVQLHQRQAWIR